jgi:hypothetical protein
MFVSEGNSAWRASMACERQLWRERVMEFKRAGAAEPGPGGSCHRATHQRARHGVPRFYRGGEVGHGSAAANFFRFEPSAAELMQ